MKPDISCHFLKKRVPNPFFLASGPPTDKAENVVRAYQAGWGGVVWKTLGEDPPVVNVKGPRYAALYGKGRDLLGFNNNELISDRPLEVNLEEIRQVKKAWPDRGLLVSLMVPCEEEKWASMLRKVEATGADGVELNFGCPHGMSERGMGSAVGQVPEYVQRVTGWVKKQTHLPVMVKLTPNVTDIRLPAQAAHSAGADALSLINTINSLMGVDLDRMSPLPVGAGKTTHGGYCGPAVRPIALHMLSEVARMSPVSPRMALSGIGGITNWRDAVEFLLLGAGMVQVCTAAMTFGFQIISDLCSGLEEWMAQKRFATLDAFIGKALSAVTRWDGLDMDTPFKAYIHQDLCIGCGRCYSACTDTAHQAITHIKNGQRYFEIIDEACVGCALCACVCPIEHCIEMRQLPPGAIDPRTGERVPETPRTWQEYVPER